MNRSIFLYINFCQTRNSETNHTTTADGFNVAVIKVYDRQIARKAGLFVDPVIVISFLYITFLHYPL